MRRPKRKSRTSTNDESNGTPPVTPESSESAPLVLQQDTGRGEVRKDAGLIARSVKERWPSTEERRIALRDRVQEFALREEDGKTLALLVRTDVAMESQNQKDQLAQIQPEGGVNVTIINDLRKEMESIRNDERIRERIYDEIAGPYRSPPGGNGAGRSMN